MKRTLTLLLLACLLPALSVRAQESLNDAIMQLSETVRAISAKGGFPSPGSLTDEEWARIPADLRPKIYALLENKTPKGLIPMVEDGTTVIGVPASSIFIQYARDREAPKEGNYVYSRWCDMTDISAAYISPEMFSITLQVPKIDIQGRQLDLTPVVRDFKGLYMLDFAQYRKGNRNVRYNRNSTSGGLRRDIRDFLDQGGYVTLMDLRKDGFYTRVYMAASGQVVTGFVLVHLDDNFDYGRFVCLEGNMDRAEFEKLIAKAIK